MIRTSEEEREYQNLPKEIRDQYDLVLGNNPSFTHAKIMHKCAMITEVINDDWMSGALKNFDHLTHSQQRTVLERLSNFISQYAPIVWEKVKGFFTNAIDYLSDLIDQGIEWIGEKIDDVLEYIKEAIFG